MTPLSGLGAGRAGCQGPHSRRAAIVPVGLTLILGGPAPGLADMVKDPAVL